MCKMWYIWLHLLYRKGEEKFYFEGFSLQVLNKNFDKRQNCFRFILSS